MGSRLNLMPKVLTFVSIFEIIACFTAPNFWKIRKLVETQQHRQIEQLYRVGVPPKVQEIHLKQPLNHFDAFSEETYSQRVYINIDNWKKPDGPVFLYIGGEGTLRNSSAYSGHHVEMAKFYGAMVVAAEHRFYGDSINDDGLKLEVLQHLSSQQGLADLTGVHKYITNRYELTDQNTWICFGGSYPGALSAWFRLKYPHLVYGAIASSAPVQAQTDFTGYSDVVAKSLSDPVVGGSSECLTKLTEAFTQIDDMIQSGKLNKLQQDFHSCGPLTSADDQMVFVNNLAGIIMGVVQYNNELAELNIKKVCDVITSSNDPYSNLAKINKMMMEAMNQTCVDNTYSKFLSQFSNTTVDRRAVRAGIRQWIWQTCTQFGYYATCEENTKCPFSKLLTLESNLVICEKVYNIPQTMVSKFVEFTNEYYGSNHPRGTRILFVNGSIDPWHYLSVLTKESESETAVYINGTAHCADMGTSKKTDPQSLKDARMMIQKQIGLWLNEARMQ